MSKPRSSAPCHGALVKSVLLFPLDFSSAKNSTSLYYLARDLVLATLAWEVATWIDPVADGLKETYPEQANTIRLAGAGAWLT